MSLLNTGQHQIVLVVDKKLRKESQLDGTKRLDFSTAQLPQPIPQHAVEDGERAP